MEIKKIKELIQKFKLDGEYFDGHPEDPKIRCEFYLWNVPGEDFIKELKNILKYSKFDISSNVITLYK